MRKIEVEVPRTPEWLSQYRGQIVQLQKKRYALEQELMNPLDMKSGSLSLQYKRCGKPGCKCMDKENPMKHGPYYYLITCKEGKTVLRYVKDRDDREAIQRYEIYEGLLAEYEKLGMEIATAFNAIKERRARGR